MIKEFIINRLLIEVYNSTKMFLLEKKRHLLSIKDDILNGIESHIKEVNNWSSEVTFRDLSNSKLTTKIYIVLDFYFNVRRLSFNSSELKRLSLETLFEASINHIILYGQPGAGKTTSVKYLCQKVLLDENFYPDKFHIPIAIRLRELKHSEKHKDDEGVFQRLFKILNLNIKFRKKDTNDEIEWVKQDVVIRFLEGFKVLLILDGFDEIPFTNKKFKIFKEIQHLTRNLNNATIILTSRTGDFNYSVDNSNSYELCPLDNNQIEEFVSKWILDVEKSKLLLSQIKNSPFYDTAVRPLNLAHICAIFERDGSIPEKPKSVYKKIINLLIEEWSSQRGIIRKSKYAGFEIDRKFEFLSNLAFLLTTEFKSTTFSLANLREIYKGISQDFGLPINQEKLVIDELEAHIGLFVQSGYNSFEFVHKSLQEYLTAEYIVKLPSIPRESDMLLKLPNELALVLAISSKPSFHFYEIIWNRLRNKIVSDNFINSFLERIVLEKVEFNYCLELGLALCQTYTICRVESMSLAYGFNSLSRIEEILIKISRQAKVKQSLSEILEYYSFKLKAEDGHSKYLLKKNQITSTMDLPDYFLYPIEI